jgi:hypothetical protein
MTIQAIKVTNLKSESANSNFGTPTPLKPFIQTTGLSSGPQPLFRPPASLQAPRPLFRLPGLSTGSPASLQAPRPIIRLPGLFRLLGLSSGTPASLQAPRPLFRLLGLSPGTPASLQAPWPLFRLLSLTLQASQHLPRHLPPAFAPSICQICQLTPTSVEHLIYPSICIP